MAHDIHDPEGIWFDEDELVKIRLHYFSKWSSRELLAMFSYRDELDEASKLALAKFLFGKNATVESAVEEIRKRGQGDRAGVRRAEHCQAPKA